MVLRYIGYGITDINGIAKLDHDANGNLIDGYVGTGEGEITFVATSASGILSNRVTIMDNPLPMQVVLSISDISVDIGTTVTLTATVTENGQSVGSGKTVTFKQGTTTIGTSQTNSSGIATYSYVTNTVGTLSIIAVCNNVYSTAKSLIVHKTATNLSLNVPQLVYSDEFNITGVLTNSHNTGISGASVKLKWQINGTTYESSAETTNTNGEVTFHRSAPTSIRTFKFWLSYDGDANYEASNSSEETRIVGKETSVVNVNAPASIVYGETLNMTGSLVDNDGSPIASATVVMYVDGSSVGISITTQNDGSFSVSRDESLSVGTHTFNFVYGGNTYYTNVSLQKTVVVTLSYNSIVCSANKSILSYADSDKATLYAQLMNNGSSVSVSNVPITFKNGSTVLGSALTDATGLATLTNGYSSAGVGDISITANDGNFVSETYEVEDCLYYSDGMTKITSNWSKDTSVSGRTIYKLTPNYQSDVELTFKLKGTIPSNFIIGFGETGGSPAYWSKLIYFRYNGTLYAVADNSDNISLSNPSISTNTIFKFTTSNLHSITGYLDGVSKITRNTNSGHGLNLRIDDFGGLDIDYLKVKPL